MHVARWIINNDYDIDSFRLKDISKYQGQSTDKSWAIQNITYPFTDKDRMPPQVAFLVMARLEAMGLVDIKVDSYKVECFNPITNDKHKS